MLKNGLITGFLNFQWRKLNIYFLLNKKLRIDLKLKIYNIELEQVKIRFLGLWFDSKVTWNCHLSKMEEKCKKILNVMRCISGREGVQIELH